MRVYVGLLIPAKGLMAASLWKMFFFSAGIRTLIFCVKSQSLDHYTNALVQINHLKISFFALSQEFDSQLTADFIRAAHFNIPTANNDCSYWLNFVCRL